MPFGNVASGCLCVPQINRMKVKEFSYFTIKFSIAFIQRTSHKFPTLYMLGGFAETSSLPVAPDACCCSSTGGQVGLLFWRRWIKLFEASHRDLFHTKMNVFLISPQICPFSLNTFRWLYNKGGQTAAREPHAKVRWTVCRSLSLPKTCRFFFYFLFLLRSVEML